MAAGFKKATVDSASVAATQTNFPSYVDLSRIGITTLAEAQSVRVYAEAAKTTEWAREIVSATEMHVKIPSITTTTDIYVDWDGTSADYGATETYGRNAVWSDYVAVYHLKESGNGTAGEYIDSAGNYNAQGGRGTAANTPTQTASGKIGNAQSYDGTNDNIDMNESTGFDVGTGNVSMSVWFKTSRATAQTNGSMFSWGKQKITSAYDGVYLEVIMGAIAGDRGKTQFTVRGGGTTKSTGYSTSTYNNGAFHHHVGVRDGDNVISYTDGASTSSTTGASGINATNTSDIGLGCNNILYNNLFDGVLDEARYRKSVLSANWILTEYNNQNDEATFWGTWSTVSGTANTTNFFYMT